MEWNNEIVRSRQNRTVVEICKLADRKAREDKRLFRFDGIKLFVEALQNGLDLQVVALRESSAEQVRDAAVKACGESAFVFFSEVKSTAQNRL